MTRQDSPKEFMRRGVRLFIAGYALNFFRATVLILIAQALGIDVDTTALDTFLVGDILQLAGLSFLLTGLLKRIAIRPLWILCLALLMQAAGIWGSSYSAQPDLLHMLMRTVLYTGAYSGFPLMLWFVYPASGMVFGEMLKRTGNKDLFYKKTLSVSITMLATMVSNMLRTGYDMRCLYALA